MRLKAASLAPAGRYAWQGTRAALIAYLLVVLMFSRLERWMVYPAPPLSAGDWVSADLPHQDVYFSADDGTQLHGWYVPHPAARAAVLFSHGNGEHVARLAPVLAQLRERAA